MDQLLRRSTTSTATLRTSLAVHEPLGTKYIPSNNPSTVPHLQMGELRLQ
jgi:hypothetical protein